MGKGWFKIPGVQDGDRTIAEQLKGLGRLLDEVAGQTVLDLGCAEGLIANALLERGAARVFGVEIVAAAVETARRFCDSGDFICYDLNAPDVAQVVAARKTDVVIMLAILHKLRDPFRLLDAVIANEPKLVVIRTATATPGYVRDSRSGNVKFDVSKRLTKAGYVLEHVDVGHFDEWVGYFRCA
jgi:predicted RNA methylase